jgi:hypothetical protein
MEGKGARMAYGHNEKIYTLCRKNLVANSLSSTAQGFRRDIWCESLEWVSAVAAILLNAPNSIRIYNSEVRAAADSTRLRQRGHRDRLRSIRLNELEIRMIK